MNILITGASSDVSKALTEILLKEGHSVILTCSSDESIETNSKLWKDKNVDFIKFNLESPEKSEKEFTSKKIDAVVLNAWNKVDKLKNFHEFTSDEIEKEFSINVRGNSELIRYILPSMMKNNLGRILFISSMVTVSGTSKYGPYGMAKAAIEALMRNIAVDYGEYNISANTVRPGIIKTERTSRFCEREFYVKRVTKGILLRKLGEPKEIAQACLPFLYEQTYLTGTELNVSGGLPLFNTSSSLKGNSNE